VDTLGINWSYLLVQFANCLLLALLPLILIALLVVLIRRSDPVRNSRLLARAQVSQDGLLLSKEFLRGAAEVEIRERGQILLVLLQPPPATPLRDELTLLRGPS